MKKLISFLFVFIFIVGGFNYNIKAENTPNNRDIFFSKRNPSGHPHAPALYPVSFSGTFYMDIIILYSENYSGDIIVQIIGTTNNLIQTLQISDSMPVLIDISSLFAGTYTIEIITNGKGIFTGDFEI